MTKIHSALIYLDDDMPEYMLGMIRIAEVKFLMKMVMRLLIQIYQNSFVNIESHENNPEMLIKYVAKKLGIDESNVEIE